MRKRSKNISGIIAAAFLGILLWDTSTALEGAAKGLDLCIRTVIPSLFPFIYLSSWLTSSFRNSNNQSDRFLCKLYHLPDGAGIILLSGLLGGYPVGARCVGQAVRSGQISAEAAKRMVVFCNAAGPSFLFGIVGAIFPQRWVPWALWGIHFFSTILIAWILPVKAERSFAAGHVYKITPTDILRQSLKSISEICGWIILTRVMINILETWVLWRLPDAWSAAIIGILELSNGCLGIRSLDKIGLRFVLCALFLGFGGFCVSLQTSSSAYGVDLKYYIPGKIVQAGTCFLLACFVQRIAFSSEHIFHLPVIVVGVILGLLVLVAFTIRKQEKNCGNFDKLGV